MASANENTSTKIIFIAGYQRSGTTWFANIVNAHPSVIYRHEVIGRCFSAFPERLFNSLKYDYGLSDEDYKTVVDAILAARIETDRPPFFRKDYLWIQSSRIHQLFWLAAKSLSFIRPVYQFFYQPRSDSKVIAIKETRSSVDMESMLQSLRTYKNIFLFRHPCGCVASSLAGIESGKMAASTESERKMSYKEMCESNIFRKYDISENDILSMPEYSYLALLWSFQNEDYIRFSEKFKNSLVISFENFRQSPVESSRKLFSELSLSFTDKVEEFIESSSNVSTDLSLLKRDSGSSYYSVYRKAGFNPNNWKNTLSAEQIEAIENYTMDTYDKMVALDTISLSCDER